MKFGIKLLILLVGISLYPIMYQEGFGHGLGYEILPPVQVGDKSVSLEVQSSQFEDPDNPDREISFALFDTSNGITINDVTYHIKAEKGGQFLFEDTFKSDNGIFVFNLLQSDSNEVILEKENQGSFFDALIGTSKDVVNVRGAAFQRGGLYNFDVNISTIDSYSNELEEPVEFKVGLSIPDRTWYDVQDPNFGTQKVSVITYYDEIKNFQYDQSKRSISFSMPFTWDFDNINQTSVVHEELTFGKMFGDLLVSSYSVSVNGFELPERVITIDDFSEDQRIVHMVINQMDLFELLEKQNNNADGMNFVLKPLDDKISTVTGNGQFRIDLDWEPKDIRSGSETKFLFYVTDVFLKGRPVLVDYDVRVINENDEFYAESGKTTGIRDQSNEFSVTIPEGISGPLTIQFENLDGSSLANVGIPVAVNRIGSSSAEISIPDWVRNNAEWWADGLITDDDFAKGIEFMIQKEIIIVPVESSEKSSDDVTIPDWVRNNAEWWADGLITDDDFAKGIQFLVSKGIIFV